MILAFCPYFTFVLCNNGLGNRKTEAEAAGLTRVASSAPCLVSAVKAFEEMGQIVGGYFRAFIRHRQ